MNKISTVILFAFCFFYNSLYAQDLSIQKFYLSKNSNRISFVTEKGDYFGCGINLECMPLAVKMYSIKFDAERRKFIFCGRVFFDGVTKDTVTIGGVSILVAQPTQDTLKYVRVLGKTVEKSSEELFPYRRGDFRIEFVYTQNEKLYFSHPIFTLVEYDIGKLIQGELLKR